MKNNQQILTLEQAIEVFREINQVEMAVRKLRMNDIKEYHRIKKEAYKLEPDKRDELIWDCLYTEEPKIIRYYILNIGISGNKSELDFALDKLSTFPTPYWKSFFNGEIKVEPNDLLLYINLFVLGAVRSSLGSKPDLSILNSSHYLDQFLREKKLSALIEFNFENLNTSRILKICKIGNFEKVRLEKENKDLVYKIETLRKGIGYEEQ